MLKHDSKMDFDKHSFDGNSPPTPLTPGDAYMIKNIFIYRCHARGSGKCKHSIMESCEYERNYLRMHVPHFKHDNARMKLAWRAPTRASS